MFTHAETGHTLLNGITVTTLGHMIGEAHTDLKECE